MKSVRYTPQCQPLTVCNGVPLLYSCQESLLRASGGPVVTTKEWRSRREFGEGHHVIAFPPIRRSILLLLKHFPSHQTHDRKLSTVHAHLNPQQHPVFQKQTWGDMPDRKRILWPTKSASSSTDEIECGSCGGGCCGTSGKWKHSTLLASISSTFVVTNILSAGHLQSTPSLSQTPPASPLALIASVSSAFVASSTLLASRLRH